MGGVIVRFGWLRASTVTRSCYGFKVLRASAPTSHPLLIARGDSRRATSPWRHRDADERAFVARSAPSICRHPGDDAVDRRAGRNGPLRGGVIQTQILK